jgi:hypothetical protein
LKVPFADNGGSVAGLLQQLGEGLLAAVKFDCIVDDAVEMAVFAGQDYGPAGCAYSICAKAIIEAHTLSGKPVEVRRFVDFAAVTAYSVCGVVICHNEYDVRPVFFTFLCLAESNVVWKR